MEGSETRWVADIGRQNDEEQSRMSDWVRTHYQQQGQQPVLVGFSV